MTEVISETLLPQLVEETDSTEHAIAPIDDWDMACKALAPHIRGFLHNRIADAAEAEDVTQETLLRAWRNNSRFAVGQAILPLVIVMAKRQMVDSYRKKDVRQGKDTYLSDVIENRPHNEEASTMDAFDNIDLTIETQRAISRLSHHKQQVIQLTLLGFTQTEIAAELQIPLGTVKTRTARAYTDLRKYLYPLHEIMKDINEFEPTTKSQQKTSFSSRQRARRQAGDIAASRERANRSHITSA